MCGLVGMAGDLEYRDEAVMKKLLILDAIRGEHSTGFAAVRKQSREFHVAKVAGTPYDLFDNKKFDSALTAHSSNCFIGHNRFATRGAINAYNAHPFEHDDIVGAHNGTLDYYRSLEDLEKKIDEKNSVDSRSLIIAISKLGVEESISTISGAWALTYYNRKNNSINMLRNSQRPLWVAYSEDFKVMWWASEYLMIELAIASTSGYRKLWKDKDGHRFFYLPEDTHFSYPIDLLMEGKFPKPVVKELKGRAWQGSGPTNHPFAEEFEWKPQGQNNVRNIREQRLARTNSTTRSRLGTNGDSKPVVSLIEATEDEPYGLLVTPEQFKEWSKGGCGYCSADIRWGDTGIAILKQEEAVLCSDCNNGERGPVSRIYVPLTDFVNK